jgi:hypothetical protein
VSFVPRNPGLNKRIGNLLRLAPATGPSYYEDFYAVDFNGAEVPLNSFPLATAESLRYTVYATPLAPEDFESFPASTPTPLNISFGGGVVTGIISVTPGSSLESTALVLTNVPGSTNGVGRYSLPVLTSSHFFNSVCVPAPDYLEITFSQDVKGFSTWCTDLGDFSGTITVQYFDASNNLIHTQPIDNSGLPVTKYNAAVSFFGCVAVGGATQFRKVRFVSTGASQDFFGLDLTSVALVGL